MKINSKSAKCEHKNILNIQKTLKKCIQRSKIMQICANYAEERKKYVTY